MFSARRLENIRKGPVTQFNIDSQMTHCTRQMIQYGGGMKQLRVLHGTEAGKKDTLPEKHTCKYVRSIL